VAGRWWTPQRALVSLDIEIDTDGDGNAEAALLNSTGDGLIRGEVGDPAFMNDALITVVRQGPSTSTNYVAGGIWNVLEPALRDTAPYQNSVVVHSAPATALGLGEGRTGFHYRAVTHGDYDDQTPWVRFDAARPAVDATPFGLEGSPFFDEGRSVRVRVDRANAAAAGYGVSWPLRVLLLHQHQAAGQQVETVTLDLASEDTDGDGLADALELERLGDLEGDGTTDRDGDGAKDSQELLAGRTPWMRLPSCAWWRRRGRAVPWDGPAWRVGPTRWSEQGISPSRSRPCRRA